MKVISDAAVLIGLAKIGRLDLLRKLYGKIYIPWSVYEEVVVRGGKRPGVEEVNQAKWISQLHLPSFISKIAFKSPLTPLYKTDYYPHLFLPCGGLRRGASIVQDIHPERKMCMDIYPLNIWPAVLSIPFYGDKNPHVFFIQDKYPERSCTNSFHFFMHSLLHVKMYLNMFLPD